HRTHHRVAGRPARLRRHTRGAVRRPLGHQGRCGDAHPCHRGGVRRRDPCGTLCAFCTYVPRFRHRGRGRERHGGRTPHHRNTSRRLRPGRHGPPRRTARVPATPGHHHRAADRPTVPRTGTHVGPVGARWRVGAGRPLRRPTSPPARPDR